MKKFMTLMLSAVLAVTMFAGCTSTQQAAETVENKAEEVAEDVKDAAEEVKEGVEAAVEATPEAETATEEPAPAADPEALPVASNVDGKSIGICIYKFDDNFMTLYRNELERYLSSGGASVQVMDGKNDQAEQTNQIQNFITQGVDALIVNLVQASAAPQIADLCHNAGIPVVFINREPEPEEEARWKDNSMLATYVGADARQSGTYQGEIIAETANKGDVNGDGVIGYAMIMGDPENVDAQYRTEFSIKALTDAGLTVENLFEQRGDWDQAKGQELAANALAASGDKIDVIFCNNDAMAMGALQAIESAGRKVNEDIYLVGVDALAEALAAIGQGRMTGTVFNDHFSQARTASDRVSDYINGAAVENVYMVDYVKVTPDNANEILDLLG